MFSEESGNREIFADSTPGQSRPEYHLTILENRSVPASLLSQIRGLVRERERRGNLAQDARCGRLPVLDMSPWYRDLPGQIRGLFEKQRVAPSRAVDVPDIWREYPPNPFSWANSLLAHVLALTAILLPFHLKGLICPVKGTPKIIEFRRITFPLALLKGDDATTGGGGGGGRREPLPASRGPIPPFQRMQLAPPTPKVPNLTPLMPVQASLLGPPQLRLPEMKENAVWGDPHGVLGPLSAGPGTGNGIGDGDGTGVGPGRGGGYDEGDKWGYGGGAPQVGGSVSAPVVIYRPEPPYSEEARKAKLQGVVSLWIVVDAQGNVSDVRVAKPLGMGLDEKAVETVRTWRFRPGKRNGTSIPVRVLVEVNFRLL